VSTPCRLSPRDASATLLTALLTVRGRTPKKAVEERLGTGSATVREGAAPKDAQVSGPGYWPSTERHWGGRWYRTLDSTTVRLIGQLRFPCEEGRSRRPNISVAR